ncbi:MAG: flagellar export chaperone FliS [Desulfuromonadaceae bacterium]|nr:flagellar export chaperone FliS [Desulfuromonadaceae bacterium]
MNAYTQQYQQNQILSASAEQILIMLYDGAIRFTRQAIAGVEAEDKLKKLEGTRRAMAIITEFANTLDHKIGGDIAQNLDALYAFMTRELTRANLENDVARYRVVENLLTGLRSTWVEAIEIRRSESATTAQGESRNVYTPQVTPDAYRPLSASG